MVTVDEDVEMGTEGFATLLTQPQRSPKQVETIVRDSQWAEKVRFFLPKRHRTKANAVRGKNGRDFAGEAADCALIAIVSWVVAASPDGVTVSWSKEHVAPLGRPEQVKVTGELNPFSGVTVSMSAAWPPELTVSEGSETLRTKSGCNDIV